MIICACIAAAGDAEGQSSRMSWLGMGKRIEEFLAGKLLGNVRKGEENIMDFVSRVRSSCQTGESRSKLCELIDLDV